MTIRNSANSLLTRLLNKTLTTTAYKATSSTADQTSKPQTSKKVLPQSASILGFAQLPSNKSSGGSPPLWFPFRKKK